MKLRLSSSLLAFCILTLCMAGSGNAQQLSKGPMCWTSEELRGRPGEWEIKKNVNRAFQMPPNRSLLPASTLKSELRGIIRRVRVPEGVKVVALTFDVCELPYEVAGYDSRIVDYLRDENVKATFFTGGKWLLTHETRAQQLLTDPLFEIGNHSWEHRNLRIVPPEVLHEEIDNAQRAYDQIREDYKKRSCRARNEATPERMSTFRFPYGACNADALKAVNDAGFVAIQWDIASADPSPAQDAPRIVHTVMSRVKPGSIMLFHANGRGRHTIEALREIIPRLKADGYRFLTVSELLRYPGAVVEKADSCFNLRPGDLDKYDELALRLEEKFQKFYRDHGAFGPGKSTLR